MKSAKSGHRRCLNVIVLFIAVLFMIASPTYGGSKKKMESLYDFKNVQTIAPVIYKHLLSGGGSVPLFSVPFDNAVGTNNVINGITVLSFPEGKLCKKNYFRWQVEDMRGSGKYLPLISEHEVGFAHDRVFYHCNFKTKKCREHDVVFSLDETIENLAVSDARKKWFIFEVKSYNSHSEDHRDSTYNLLLVDLSGKEPKLIKERDIGRGSIWTAAFDRVFLWHFNRKVLEVFDLNLEPAEHPLGDVIKKNKDKLDFNRICPHPSLPLSLFSGGEYGAMFLIWGTDKKNTAARLFGGSYDFIFSPDAKWVSFSREDYRARKIERYLMPVSEKYPNYLGSPIFLVDEAFRPQFCTWTNNPISLVCAHSDRLFRWELTKEAQKEMMGDDYDKYETFHDWIVAKDLEKLTKEKKQGLK